MQEPFELLLNRHGAAILRVCRALVGPQEADDVWQETFLAALNAYPSTQPANTEAWLVTIARNKSIDHLRKANRLPQPSDPHEEPPAAGAVGTVLTDDVVSSVMSSQRTNALWLAIARLPQKQREALAYHHLGGLPYAEVAKILGNSVPAARRAAADGMAALRILLNEQVLKGELDV